MQIEQGGKCIQAHLSGFLGLAVGGLCAGWLFFAIEPIRAFDAPATPLASIHRLGDPRFEVREQATKALEQAGIAAIAPLRDAAAGENLEVTSRAIKSLAAILDTDDEATFDAAEAALEQLEASSNSSAGRRAFAALASQPVRRWSRAVARLNLQGGGIKPRTRGESGPPELHAETGGVALPESVILGPNWNGGEAGLTNVKRLTYALRAAVNSNAIAPIPLPLPLYVIDGAKIAPEALEELQQSLPGLEIQERGPAMLGVKWNRGEAGVCTIYLVEPEKAAAKAGLRGGDVVVRYDGETVTNFDQLTQITRRHKPGDRVKIDIRRDGQMVELEAELSDWTDLAVLGPKPKEK